MYIMKTRYAKTLFDTKTFSDHSSVLQKLFPKHLTSLYKQTENKGLLLPLGNWDYWIMLYFSLLC